MNLEIHLVIARLREKLESKRLHLALRAPDVTHSKDCADNRACSNAWDSSWLNTIGRKVLHPDVFRPPISEVKNCAESLQVPEMCHECFTQVASAVRDIQVWDFEDELIKKAVDLLTVPAMDVALPLNGGDPMDI